MDLKEIFGESESLTLAEFMQRAEQGNAKFVDLSEGKYVSKMKYENDLKLKDNELTTLNETLSSRDTDLANLNSKLAEAGTNSEKLNSLSTDFANLKTKYEQDTKALQDRLNAQNYEFAVKEYANSKKFTSHAAKRDFERSMIEKKLTLENGSILGADDFAKAYANDNADAFAVETTESKAESKPMFTKTIQDTSKADDTNGFASAFNFIGVRPKN